MKIYKIFWLVVEKSVYVFIKKYFNNFRKLENLRNFGNLWTTKYTVIWWYTVLDT